MSFLKLAVSTLAVAAVSATAAAARDQIRIVGSSTVFPFSTAVAEQFGRTTDFKTPVVESTGSGGGMKLFCAGVGQEHPDITNASRRMKAGEFKMCQENGVTEITEAKIGFDGIVIANAMDAPEFDITLGQLWTALAADGPRPSKWSEIDPSLPDIKIEVLGPPPSSGTRDSFEELAMYKGCREAGKDKAYCKKEGRHVREDGVFVEAGENDNLIVSKLEANPDALGVFGFSFLDQNSDALKGAKIDGVEPNFETISAGDYPISRSMYFYIKNAHVGVVPGIQEYANEFMSDAASGEEGYLVDKGLIPLPADEHAKWQESVRNLTPMTGNEWN
ncbi:substrate-binding domain-containing protein [Jhaorihella thermophila]|uniref:Phosphate transport system substrate-binding protein n=1 Tax=Jhaorihella thermophila TaxID=488547 RepID=A0A1H5SIT2_9RHOB|nr:substrate-binding domain-containing protein [Jhaorihella thermophila]SEF50516.1 phosphate transport system substrate-binding protein [Jhaorihella thermophila]